jgi:hypothetical protein
MALLVGCGGGSKGERDNAMAKALDNRTASGSKEEDIVRMKKLKAKAEEDAQKAYDDELDKITSLSPPLPADVETACADAGAGLDAFMQKRLVGDELARWNATKEPDMRKAVEDCKTHGKIEIGVCYGKALRDASVAEFANGSQGDIKEACKKRYGAAVASAGVAG